MAAIATAKAEAKAEAKEESYPIGSLYYNADDSTNPGDLLGFGTWEAYAQGRVPVGIDPSDADFDTPGETGGEKAHTLTVAQMPPHNHAVWAGYGDTGTGDSLRYQHWAGTARGWKYSLSSQNTISTEGGGQAHNNLQPYITVYVWRRVS